MITLLTIRAAAPPFGGASAANPGKLVHPNWASASRRDTTAPVDPSKATAQRR